MKLIGTMMVAAIAVAGCGLDNPPCGIASVNNADGESWCTDTESPQFHRSSLDCGAFATDSYKPAWCETGCMAQAPETGAACSTATNPFWSGSMVCSGTHDFNGHSGCCMTMTATPASGLRQNAVMFFACH